MNAEKNVLNTRNILNIYTYNSPQLWKHWPWKVLGVDTELVAYILFTKRNVFFPLLTSHYSSGDNSLRGSRTEQHSGFINTALSVISSKGHHQLKVNSTNPELFYLLNATHHHLLLFFSPLPCDWLSLPFLANTMLITLVYSQNISGGSLSLSHEGRGEGEELWRQIFP